MPICKHEDFLIKTNHHKNLLGIDHGSKLIGIAISNKELFIATPLTTIVRKKQNVDFNEILKIIKEKDVGGIVVGLPLNMNGTKFQLKVWNFLKTIPKGTVKTYKEVAIGIKSPKSARAVANACGKNPYAPKIPCHRVIRSDGGLGGYSGRGGIKKKLILLRSEKVDI